MKSKLTLLSYGAGQDSDTILKKYIHDPAFRSEYAPQDFIVVMSDTGDEHASTYKHIIKTEELCRVHGIEFALITKDMGLHGSWGDLRSFYRRTNTVGSKAFPKTCTDKLKIQPIYKYLETYIASHYPAIPDEYVFPKGRKRAIKTFASLYGKITVLIGFAKGEEGRISDNKNPEVWMRDGIEKRYPLVDLGMDRKDCQDYIRDLGYEVPTPSNCVLCPWMNEIELLYLHRFHRTDFEEWVVLEANKIEANQHKPVEKNVGVWGSTILLPEKIKEVIEKHGSMSDEDLVEYKMSHGHCVKSKY